VVADDFVVADQADRRRRRTSPADHTRQGENEPTGMLALQQLAGNRAVSGMIAREQPPTLDVTRVPAIQRQSTPRGSPPPIKTQGSMPAIFMEYGSTQVRESGGVDSMIHFMHALVKIRDYETRQRRARKPAKIVLHGSASEDGDAARNISLSQARADRIKQLLTEAGVMATIETIGHGAAGTFPDLPSNRCVLIELIGDTP
jgi:hypothetical protein